ncbi:hypothetical protein HDV00_000256 [Rhizophlyctis rosea]|nr:hypothetical protein HDV00_000256 [Rhizophlyctis rosea]
MTALYNQTIHFTRTADETHAALKNTLEALNDFQNNTVNALTQLQAITSARINHATVTCKQSFGDAVQTSEEIAEAAKRVEKERKALERESGEFDQMRQEWQEEFEKKMHEADRLERVQASKIKLDIGGKLFHTSIDTLLTESNTFFQSLFSGRWNITPTPDGTIFIDRDSDLYTYIFDYLRIEGLKARLQEQVVEKTTIVKPWEGRMVTHCPWCVATAPHLAALAFEADWVVEKKGYKCRNYDYCYVAFA